MMSVTAYGVLAYIATRPGAPRPMAGYYERSLRWDEDSALLAASEQLGWQVRFDVPRGELSTSIAEGAVVDWADEFGREAPLIVEIGSGAGDSLVPMAAGRPVRLMALALCVLALLGTWPRVSVADDPPGQVSATTSTPRARPRLTSSSASWLERWTM